MALVLEPVSVVSTCVLDQLHLLQLFCELDRVAASISYLTYFLLSVTILYFLSIPPALHSFGYVSRPTVQLSPVSPLHAPQCVFCHWEETFSYNRLFCFHLCCVLCQTCCTSHIFILVPVSYIRHHTLRCCNVSLVHYEETFSYIRLLFVPFGCMLCPAYRTTIHIDSGPHISQLMTITSDDMLRCLFLHCFSLSLLVSWRFPPSSVEMVRV